MSKPTKSAGIDKVLAQTSPVFRAVYGELDRKDPTCGKETLLNFLADYLAKGKNKKEAELLAVKAIFQKKPTLLCKDALRQGRKPALRIAAAAINSTDRAQIQSAFEGLTEAQIIQKVCAAVT